MPSQGSPVNVTFTFVGYIKGSWLLSTSGSTTQANTVFRSTQNTTSNTLLDIASFYGVYDANPSGTGECKSVRIKDINALQTNKPLLEFESSANNNYQCDYPINWYESAEEAGDDYVERTTLDLDTSNNQFKINDSVCHLLGIDDLELDALYVSCEASASRFNVEIWQPL